MGKVGVSSKAPIYIRDVVSALRSKDILLKKSRIEKYPLVSTATFEEMIMALPITVIDAEKMEEFLAQSYSTMANKDVAIKQNEIDESIVDRPKNKKDNKSVKETEGIPKENKKTSNIDKKMQLLIKFKNEYSAAQIEKYMKEKGIKYPSSRSKNKAYLLTRIAKSLGVLEEWEQYEEKKKQKDIEETKKARGKKKIVEVEEQDEDVDEIEVEIDEDEDEEDDDDLEEQEDESEDNDDEDDFFEDDEEEESLRDF